MAKIILDLSGETRNDVACVLFSGCRKILERLGPYADMVISFEITEATFKGFTGPKIQVNFIDPFGNKSARCLDYRFIGIGDGEPSSGDIAKHFVPILLPEMEKFLKKAQESAPVMMKKIKRILGSSFSQ